MLITKKSPLPLSVSERAKGELLAVPPLIQPGNAGSLGPVTGPGRRELLGSRCCGCSPLLSRRARRLLFALSVRKPPSITLSPGRLSAGGPPSLPGSCDVLSSSLLFAGVDFFKPLYMGLAGLSSGFCGDGKDRHPPWSFTAASPAAPPPSIHAASPDRPCNKQFPQPRYVPYIPASLQTFLPAEGHTAAP